MPISAEVRKEREEKKGETVIRSQLYYGSPFRGFTVAHTIDRAEAKCHGLDLYSLCNSIRAVRRSRSRYCGASRAIANACLTPRQSDPATYGDAALTGVSKLRARSRSDAHPSASARAPMRSMTASAVSDAPQNTGSSQCRALPSDHVLRIAHLVESAQYVFHALFEQCLGDLDRLFPDVVQQMFHRVGVMG